MPSEDLHALVAGFADVAAVYERGRPEYPPAVVERVVAELGAGARPPARVLDLGAGTGKLTRPLLAAGLDVVAVEPLERMRAALAAAVGTDRVLDGRAEAIPFADATLGGAVCGEAFHWFDGARAADELARVLAPGAALVIVWLINQGDEGPWTDDVRARLEPLWARGRHPSIVEGRRAEPLEGHPAFTPIERSEIAFEDHLDRDAMLAWFASFSVVGALPEDERGDMLERIAASLDRHGAGPAGPAALAGGRARDAARVRRGVSSRADAGTGMDRGLRAGGRAARRRRLPPPPPPSSRSAPASSRRP